MSPEINTTSKISQFPDEIILEILLRLSSKSICRFKLVSKRWYSLISDPNFLSFYFSSSFTTSLPPNFFLIHRELPLFPTDSPAFNSPTHLQLVSPPNISTLSIKPHLLLPNPFLDDPDPTSIVRCCDGLVLVSILTKRNPAEENRRRTQIRTPFTRNFTWTTTYTEADSLIVGNPVTKEWVCIPDSPFALDMRLCTNFITRVNPEKPWVVEKFMVVEYQHLLQTNGALIQCFSSDTGKWVVKEADYPMGLQIWRPNWSFAFEGRLFWGVLSVGLIVWDEDPFSCAGENCKKADVRLIPLPPGRRRPIVTDDILFERGMGVSGRFIHYVEFDVRGTGELKLWRLSDSSCCGEWSVLYKIEGVDIVRQVIHGMKLGGFSITFVHPLEEDTVYYETGAHVFTYNLRTRKVTSIAKGEGCSDAVPYVMPKWPTALPPCLYAAYAKEEGNELFNVQKFEEAITCYTKSITLSPNVIAYANRGMAYLKVGRFLEAEDDCTCAINLDSNYLKVYGRRAVARKEIGNLQGAIKDIEHVLKVEPDTVDMKKLYRELLNEMASANASS